MEFDPTATYYIVYVKTETWQHSRIEVRFPELNSQPFLALGGQRSAKLYSIISTTCKVYSKKIHTYVEGDEQILALSWNIACPTLIYLFSSYTTSNPSRYLSFYNNLLQMNYAVLSFFIRLLEFALPLSEYFRIEEESVYRIDHLIENDAAQIVSKMIRTLARGMQILTKQHTRRPRPKP